MSNINLPGLTEDQKKQILKPVEDLNIAFETLTQTFKPAFEELVKRMQEISKLMDKEIAKHEHVSNYKKKTYRKERFYG